MIIVHYCNVVDYNDDEIMVVGGIVIYVQGHCHYWLGILIENWLKGSWFGGC
jgi:hypothetical protein